MTITVKNFIAGSWSDTEKGRHFSSVNPAQLNEVVAQAPHSSRGDVNRAVRAAREAFPGWSATPAPCRGEYLYRVGELLRDNKSQLGELVTREMGKVLAEAVGDVQEAIDIAFYMGGEGRRLQGETVASEFYDKDCKSVREPHGVTALVTPWNFPVAIPAWKICAALVCGNTVVLKPSSQTPACAAALVSIFEQAGFPPGVINLICGFGEEVGEYLLGHKEVDAASFTGSRGAGEHLERSLAELHRPLALEMGGKNAVVVMDDADLDLALEGVLWGAFGTAGQRCTATSRLLLHEGIYETFTRRLVERASKLRLGDGLKERTQVGPLVNEEQCRKVFEYIRIGQQEGAKLLTGGTRAAEERLSRGCYVPPTVFGEVTAGMRLAREEIFGPVLSVLRFSDFDQAAAIVNSSPYGLSSAIYSSNVNLTAKAERDFKTGLVYVNAATIGAEVQLPFGGWRHSGSGHPEAGGKGGAIEFFSRVKVIYRDFSGKLQRAQIDTRSP